MSTVQSASRCIKVKHLTTADVDHNRPLGKFGELGGPNHVTRFVRQGWRENDTLHWRMKSHRTGTISM